MDGMVYASTRLEKYLRLIGNMRTASLLAASQHKIPLADGAYKLIFRVTRGHVSTLKTPRS
jgi:hypothetical protein